ncbi:Outer membrane protein beta-barrel domain-containing protein [Chitinophaga sp. CF118]|uniref:porin family protein n=1 Tax=Chitinophaga sp. CF118 TaxID=1884367 RepID=UPI0008DF2694|nr:porin family protein [Chitinophaga sp. CF118]SFD25366.1 Outer membrane protein beta-barrel domain-containing protein [Chitinophaga sp. CF118]
MRKGILIIILLTIVLTGKAQQNILQENRVRLGFTLTPAIVTLKPQESGVTRNAGRAGISFGVMADFLLDETGRYAIASGLQVTTAGSKLKYDAGKGLDDYKANPAEYNLKLTYVEIPVALKLKTDVSDGIGFWGQFGTYLDFPVRGRADIVSLTNTYDKVNVLRDITPINMGLLIGAGIEYPLGDKLSAVVGLNYQNGFIDVTRNAKWNDGKVNMNSFALKLGLFF